MRGTLFHTRRRMLRGLPGRRFRAGSLPFWKDVGAVCRTFGLAHPSAEGPCGGHLVSSG